MITPIIVAALRAADITTGDGHARQGSIELTGRYCVVWAGIEPAADGTLVDPNADQSIQVQITSVGETQTAAGFIARQARTVALSTSLTPPAGYVWARHVPQHIVSNGVQPEPSSNPTSPDKQSWFKTDIYQYEITPAGS